MSDYQSKMYLNVYQNHFSYITNFDQFAKKFQCDKCGKIFKRLWNMKRHNSTCYDRTKYIFPGGFYKTKSTIFEKLESIGIYVPNDLRYYPYFLVWDMEAMLRKTVDDNQSNTQQLQWISKHIPVSVSIASNIPQHEDPVCIVEVSPNLLIAKMMKKFQEISKVCYEIMKERYEFVYHELEVLKDQYSQESDSESEEADTKFKSHFANVIITMNKEFDKYISQLPVIGFNSGKYDLNLVKRQIMLYITAHYQDNEIFTIKKNNSYLAIAVTDMKFLDISNYLAAGCSYSKFLKAYGCEIPKGIFPYEWFDSEEKLSQNHLPESQEFYSRLSNDNPIKTESEYQALLTIWRDEHMETFKDYLIYYNNLDTAPFAIALQNFIDIYKNEGIDIFKDYITLPGVARRMLYESSKSNFSLINHNNRDLYYIIKKNIIGGPSIIFSRYHEKSVTNIRNIAGNTCQAVVGYDCNGLYSFALKQKMPSGVFVRRYHQNNFKPEVSERYIDSYVWLDYLMKRDKVKILHKLNNQKEIRIGNFLVDGFCAKTKTVYEYNGCYYHYCRYNCHIMKKITSKNWLKKLKQVQQKDERKKQFLISQGYKYISIQECEYLSKIKPLCSKFYQKYLPVYYRKNKGSLTTSKILRDVESNKLFGAVEVDIEVKQSHQAQFKEFPPFFCTCNVKMEEIGPHMLQYCRDNDIMFDHKRLLISGLKAKKILLATPLLRWYLANHCDVTRIYQIVEFQPTTAFKSFIDTVTMHRIRGDQNPDMAIIGDTYKLLSNSSYGSVLMDRTKHSNTRYMNNKIKISKVINSPTFKTLEKLEDNLFEVETYKNSVTMDNPIQIGFFILQYAKLRMLEFYYDCLRTYLTDNSFEIIETDTDSIYMAINAPTIDQCIREEYKERYNLEIFGSCSDAKSPIWFPRRCCQRHLALDGRHLGTFKFEWGGDKMLSLCSKSYIIEDADGKQKISCKGISKRNILDPMRKFEECLRSKKVNYSTNVGFRVRDSDIFTYSQSKIGFNYFYCKRQVLMDGISTEPLEVTLTPWENEVFLVEKPQNPMSNLYICQIRMDERIFHSSEQMFCYLIAATYDQDKLCEKIIKNSDPLELQSLMNSFQDFNPSHEVMETLMRLTISLKLQQVIEFKKELSNHYGKYIAYKQVNFGKSQETFWGVTVPSKLVTVLDVKYISGNNLMGVILKECLQDSIPST